MTGIRLLLVDDAKEVRRDLRTALTLSDEVEIIGEAADGREAIQLVQALHPEAVLLDLEMPVMDGWETARQIKSQAPNCRVIALTVHDYEPARQKAYAAGLNAFLVKGVPVQTILETIMKKE